MRKVFLDELPRWEGYNGNHIKWIDCIGLKIHFIYDEIEDDILIIDYYNKKERKYILVTKYKDIIYEIGTTQFSKGNISYCLGIKSNDYKYKIGDIIKTKTGSLEILECLRIKDKYHQSGEKTYKYKCLIDGNIDKIKESHLFNGGGCNVCYNHKIIKGYNDIATTDKWMLNYIINKEDAYKYTRGSKVKILMKCPICGHKKYIQPYVIIKQGFGCNQCSDGLSYPSKMMTSILNQLKLDYIPEYCTIWSNNKKYDYYLPNENIIIEINGMQHYDGGFVRANGKTLKEEQENDKFKKIVALQNGIKESNYIVIDCRESNLEYIKNSIFNSNFIKIFNIDNIDWLKCHEYACGTVVKEICDLWNRGICNTQEIADIIKLHRSTVIRNLKKGNKIGWCNYNPKEEIYKGLKKGTKKMKESNIKKVICLNTKQIFNSLTEASKYYNLKNSASICGCCKGYNKSAGKHPITGEKLRWMYYDEYIKLKENNYKEVINF